MKVKDAHMQAFPFIEPEKDDNIKAYHPGMTMRDEFAKAAMQSLIAGSFTDIGQVYIDATRCANQNIEDLITVTAYRYADAMMKARG